MRFGPFQSVLSARTPGACREGAAEDRVLDCRLAGFEVEVGHADRGAESFRDLLLRHRGRTGRTQRQLATDLDVNVRTVQQWEAGASIRAAHGCRR